jgi:hypothetical protein
LDVHKSFSSVTVLSQKGKLTAQKKFRTLSNKYYKFFERLSEKAKLKIAFEACSMLRKVIEGLENYEEVKVAHLAKVKLITLL